MRYRAIEHTADTGVRVFGKSRRELFENAAEALADITFGIENVSASEEGGRLEASGEDLEELMVDWLGKLLLKYELEQFITARTEIDSIRDGRLSARLYGESFKPGIHEPLAEIKGVTYHGLKVEESGGIWQAEVIFDV